MPFFPPALSPFPESPGEKRDCRALAGFSDQLNRERHCTLEGGIPHSIFTQDHLKWYMNGLKKYFNVQVKNVCSRFPIG